MKTSKFLKPFSFASLALLMGAAGVFAFAPLGASPSVTNANEMVESTTTSGLGLDPKNDPVALTTESGIEIKMANATSMAGNLVADSGGKDKLLYFTAGKYNNIDVNWVIIGQPTAGITSLSTTFTQTQVATEYQTLTFWQAGKPFTSSATYFLNNTYEITTPAGLALKNDNLLNDYTARQIVPLSITTSAISALPALAEVTSGYVLCTTECYLGADRWSTSDSGSNNQFNTAINSRYSSVAGTMTAAQKALIKDNKFFGFSYSGSFKVESYLTTTYLRSCYNIGTTNTGSWWTNQNRSSYNAYAYAGNGTLIGDNESYCGKDNCYLGIRPLMLFKVT